MPRKPSPEHVLAVLLRRAVRDHAATERRRNHVPVLHVGVPGEPHEVFAIAADEPTDQALRADVVAAMRSAAARRSPTSSPLVWLTRGGDLELRDLDAAWHAAAQQAYGEADVPLRFAVVNRHGWHDLGSGTRRAWVRPRASA